MENVKEGLDIQETANGSSPSKKREVVYFSSGETLEVEETEDEEYTNGEAFRESAEKRRLSWKNVAILVGKTSLQTCDFIGEKLADVLDLTAAKYQYAIDQYHHHKATGRHDNDTGESGSMSESVGERIKLSPRHDSQYGTTSSADSHAGAFSRKSTWPKAANNGCEGDEDMSNMENQNDL